MKKQQELYKIPKCPGTESSTSSPSLLPPSLLSLKPSSGRTKPPAAQGAAPSAGLLLSQTLLGLSQANGVIQNIPQDVPLALTTKPRTDLPVNLSTGGRKDTPTPHIASTSAPPLPARPRNSRKSKTPKPLDSWKEASQNHLVQSLVDLFHRGAAEQEQERPISKDSDDSVEDDDDDEDDDVDDEEEDEEDSDDSLSGMGDI